MNDRNKTPLTHDVTASTVAYLEARGFKPVETEVQVCDGWCADIAGVICPTQTELIDMKLLAPRPNWKAPTEKHEMWQTAYGLLDRVMTCLVEVKTSRGDFNGDRKWKSSPPVDLAYIAVPKGIIRPEEWPGGWGVLEYSDGGLKRLRNPIPAVATIEQHRDVILSIAVRRDHHTRYARWRELQKEQRIRDGGEKTLQRITKISRMFLQIANGEHGSVENILDRHGLKMLPRWDMEALRNLYGIAVKSDAGEGK